MIFVIAILHVIMAIGLILVVLLQTGRGSDIGAAFGGGSSQTLFGSSGSSSFMTKLTTIGAIVFMLTSLALAYTYSHKGSSLKNIPAQTQQQSVPAQNQENAPAPAQQNAPAQGTK
ncbi:MAG: preprotein translocase subunit SecG [Syntrophorhabdus sp.]